MGDRTDRMRFKMVGATPVPLRPGEDAGGARVLSFKQAARRRGCTAELLVKLYDGVIPTPAEIDEAARQRPWQDAIADPAVWSRLEFHAGFIGQAPPAALLVAMLDKWDHMDPRLKGRAILNALDVDPSGAFVWQERFFEAKRAAAERQPAAPSRSAV
jgi:hypothetical protein